MIEEHMYTKFMYSFLNMSTLNWSELAVVHSLDEVRILSKSNGVCQYRTTNLKNSTKYSFKCSEYRKYPLCNYEVKATVPDDDPTSITVMSKSSHKHEFRNETSRLPSPVRDTVSKCDSSATHFEKFGDQYYRF